MDQNERDNLDIKNAEEKQADNPKNIALTDEQVDQANGGQAINMKKLIKTTYDILTK